MFHGIATITIYADDLGAARAWYAEVLGVDPYYAYPAAPAHPAYLEFRVGDDQVELGIVDRRYAPAGASNPPGGALAYWHVDDLAATVERLRELGAETYETITPREGGFVTASMIDPFGNVLAVMHNPHYIAQRAQGAGD